MALTKIIEIGQTEVVTAYKHIQVRTDTVIKEDGTELSRSFHRHVLTPGMLDGSDNLVETSISGEDAQVQQVCGIYWTQAVKDAWTANLSE